MLKHVRAIWKHNKTIALVGKMCDLLDCLLVLQPFSPYAIPFTLSSVIRLE